MTSTFGTWVKRRRTGRLSQDALAQKVEHQLDRRVSRDSVAKLEAGIPVNPAPEVVMAYAAALNRPLSEALEAVGYRLTEEIGGKVHPALLGVLNDVTPAAQERLAEVLPKFIELALELRHEPVEIGVGNKDNGEPEGDRAPWVRAAEEKSEYTSGRRKDKR